MKREKLKGTSGNGVNVKYELNLVIVLMGIAFILSIVTMGFSVLFSVSFEPWDELWPVIHSNLHQEDEKEVDLIPSGFGLEDDRGCLSRHESLLYRRGRRGQLAPKPKPSPHLLSKLRSYEARHKRCGPHTFPYNQTLQLLNSNSNSATSSSSTAATACSYIVWIPTRGLGNRLLTLTSAFLYALLTDRVLLLDRALDNTHALFCEPFPGTSWLLPSDFPFTNHFRAFNHTSPQSYGNILNNTTYKGYNAVLYLHLFHDFNNKDKQFFCDQDQAHLRHTPWLVMRSNNYFAPSFFLMPSFKQQLHDLFPEKDAVFHLLARYLLHPSNSVWGLITRYYQAYLSTADVTVGIQLRVFGKSNMKYTVDQIVSCTTKEYILPDISQQPRGVKNRKKKKKKRVGVLITSLTSDYYEQVRDLYYENPTSNGDVVSVFQPSNEKIEQNRKGHHNRKAWAEIYLLSLTDKLVTSSHSTFGYVAQGLGGVRPWILEMPERGSTPWIVENGTVPEPACRRAMSMEPCCHAPTYYDCKGRRELDSRVVVPHVRNCEDMSWGIKLFNTNTTTTTNIPL